ncbi:MAG: dihydropteroate synthase [Bacteroidaceae bacterium]|nr:dihydropteroate synthase [Bacteroidaceae bacterium]
MLTDRRNRKLTINAGGRLVDLSRPRVMGILNVTPDSFYNNSRCGDRATVAARVATLLGEGADMIDVGGYSSRPGCAEVSVDEEKRRLAMGLEAIRLQAPDAIVSVDTFRADVARWCVEQWGVQIINDISGGELDTCMYETIADLQVPYVMMHMRGKPDAMMQEQYLHYEDVTADVLQYFAEKIDLLTRMGVNDIIIDPGFGFSKTIDDNYRLMRHLDEFTRIGLPLLVGISRKSMIYKLLNTTPAESLNGTTVLNVLALMGGANILRVHDVKPAVEAVKIVMQTIPDTI